MRILVLSERVDEEGGTETYLRAALPALVAAGDEVRVVARSALVPAAYGVPVDVVPWSDEHDLPSPEAAREVAKLASEFAPHAVAAHNVLDSGVLRAVARKQFRIVYHIHDHRPFCPNGDRVYPQGGGICGIPMSGPGCGYHSLVHGCAYGPRPNTLLLVGIRQAVADCVRKARTTIVFSNYMAELAKGNGVRGSRVRTIAPPLDKDAFAAAPAPRPARDAVLFVGRVMASKGGRSLVRALAHIDEPRRPLLRIAGDGPDLVPMLREARARKVSVEPLGRLAPEALRAAYDDASIVAVPSLWGEPFGYVGIEAFARGRPVVAYDSGGISEWMTSSAGTLVPRGDERALADAIVDVLSSRWQECSSRAFAASGRYHMLEHVPRLRAIYAGDK